MKPSDSFGLLQILKQVNHFLLIAVSQDGLTAIYFETNDKLKGTHINNCIFANLCSDNVSNPNKSQMLLKLYVLRTKSLTATEKHNYFVLAVSGEVA